MKRFGKWLITGEGAKRYEWSYAFPREPFGIVRLCGNAWLIATAASIFFFAHLVAHL